MKSRMSFIDSVRRKVIELLEKNKGNFFTLTDICNLTGIVSYYVRGALYSDIRIKRYERMIDGKIVKYYGIVGD